MVPEITVIVPVYRVEAYLAECVESILSQTFADFEIILVDDGSPDGSGRICDEYAARDSRISVIHQSNQGQAAARNRAMTQARGKWICFVDSDDLIHPQMLELLYQAAADGGASISMCEMLEAAQLPEGFASPRSGSYECLPMDEETLVTLHDGGAYPGWVACAKLIRRELIDAHPFCEGRVYEDNEAVCRWLLPAKSLARLPEKLYFYRTNPDSTTQGRFSLKKLDYLWALESITAYYRSVGYEILAQRFLERYVEAAASACYRVREELGRPELVRKISANTHRFLRREKLTLTKQQRLSLLEAAHPEMMRRFWSGAVKVRKLWKGKGRDT